MIWFNIRSKLAMGILWLAEKVYELSVYAFPMEEAEEILAEYEKRMTKVYITDVVHGPIMLTDMPEEEIPEGVRYDDTTCLIECRMLIDNEITIKPVYTTLDHALELQKHFMSSIEPVELKL